MELIADLIFTFCVGFLLGVINAWNKKVYFFIVVALIVWVIIGVVLVPEQSSQAVKEAGINSLWNIISAFLGIFMGNKFYTINFEE